MATAVVWFAFVCEVVSLAGAIYLEIADSSLGVDGGKTGFIFSAPISNIYINPT